MGGFHVNDTSDLNIAGQNEGAPAFSAIVTSYFEEKSIEEFHRRLTTALGSLGRPYEIIMINDGSTDRTFDIMRDLFKRDPHVSAIVDFFKNSGQLAAMTAGICQSRGEAIVFIDSDLQLDPEELPHLVTAYDEGFDLVSGCRRNRKDSLSRILPSKIANMVMRKASQSALTDFGCTFKIWNAKVLRAFEFGPFRLFNTASAVSRVGRYKEVPVSHHVRRYGKSGWTFRKLWQFNMENLVNLSQKPFQVLAGLCAVTAFVFLVRLLFEMVFSLHLLPDVTNGLILNAVAISLLVTTAILSVIGEFTIRCFVASQRVPAYVIREMITRSPGETRE